MGFRKNLLKQRLYELLDDNISYTAEIYRSIKLNYNKEAKMKTAKDYLQEANLVVKKLVLMKQLKNISQNLQFLLM